MKIELRNIKVSEELSEETTAFTANIYVNGKKAGFAKNNGHGGCTDYRFDNPTVRDEVEKAVDDVELFIDNCVETHLQNQECKRIEKQFRKWCATKTMFRLKGEKPGTYHTVKAQFNEKVKQFIHSKYPEQVLEILNETLENSQKLQATLDELVRPKV